MLDEVQLGDSPAIDTKPSGIFTKYVGTFNIRSHEQPYMSLGRFSAQHPAKGFSIALDHPETNDAVVTHITSRKLGEYYELILQVKNHSSEAVRAEVWQM